jgi:hypothetical protein
MAEWLIVGSHQAVRILLDFSFGKKFNQPS